MGLLDHLTCLLRNLYAGQEATVRIGHGTTDWFQIGKGVYESCILSSCLCNLYAEYIMQSTSSIMPGWMKHKLGSRLLGEISITLYIQIRPLMAESEDEQKSLLLKVKYENEKAGLKLNIQKKRSMSSRRITS